MARNENPAPAEFTAIKAARKSNQPQLNISHAQVLALLAMSGQAKPEKGTPLSLGSPAKGKAHLIWTCATQTGETYRIVQGDTHGIWLSHQDGPGRDRDSLMLFNAVPYMPWRDHPVGLRRVKFLVAQTAQDKAPVLVREIIENTLAPIEPQPRVEVLCRGVRALNLRYYDGSDWADTWDSSSRDNTLPLAVELTIQLQTQHENQEEDQAETGPRLTTIVTIPCGDTVPGEGGRVKR